MKNILVFCGAKPGNDKEFTEKAYELGSYMAKNNLRLIYGGGKTGMMGAVADGVLENGGTVIGIIPSFLKGMEIMHPNLTELIEVETMHERKAKMEQMADAVVALPGGFGTLDEIFELLTWSQLGLHSKPLALYNIKGYYDVLIVMMMQMVKNGFLNEEHYHILKVADNLNELIEKLRMA
ncbi:MAG TPA: TIGR00730 family Rossman fold protein [Edaphocola sp.]|nr:TIGR00730 family Rossman fold protein [Edaphocola sp.]